MAISVHRYCRSHGFKSRTGLNFFYALFSLLHIISSVNNCEDPYIFVSSTAVYIYEFHIFTVKMDRLTLKSLSKEVVLHIIHKLKREEIENL